MHHHTHFHTSGSHRRAGLSYYDSASTPHACRRARRSDHDTRDVARGAGDSDRQNTSGDDHIPNCSVVDSYLSIKVTSELCEGGVRFSNHGRTSGQQVLRSAQQRNTRSRGPLPRNQRHSWELHQPAVSECCDFFLVKGGVRIVVRKTESGRPLGKGPRRVDYSHGWIMLLFLLLMTSSQIVSSTVYLSSPLPLLTTDPRSAAWRTARRM